MPVYDFVCHNPVCAKLELAQELLVKYDASPLCDCGSVLDRQPSAPMGFVTGTSTPCRGK